LIFRIRHLLILFCLLVVLINYIQVLNTFKLFFIWTGIIFSGESQQISMNVVDHFISAFAVILIPLAAIFLKSRFLNLKARSSLSLILLLALSAILAPVLTRFTPDFQKDLSATSLIPPLSKKYFLLPENSAANSFAGIRSIVLKEHLYQDIKIADSISVSGTAYFQGKEKKEVASSYSIDKRYYLLGTDELGRDIFTRIIYGTRISLTVGVFSVFISFLTGLLLGFLAGYYEGWGGTVLNRLADVFLSFPSIFLVILVLALFGNSVVSVIVVLGFTGWMPLFKIIRGEVIELRTRDFFITASSIGLDRKTLIMKELMPVIIVPVISNLVLLFGSVIVAEASLSYLGLGTGMMHPSWGSMINAGQDYMRSAWWMIFMPGMFLFVTLFAANDIGKKIQTYFNPRLK
jgi:peptide/nickel transport system permease protein